MSNIERNEGPIDYGKLIETFFRTSKNEKKYIKPLIKRILEENIANFIPELRIELKDLEDPLLQLFRNEPKEFIDYFKEGIFNRLSFEPDVKSLFELFKKKESDLHIIPDSTDRETLIPRVIDLTLNKTKFKGTFTIFEGRFMNIGIDKRQGFNSIRFRCTSCLSEFDKYYLNNIDNRIKSPEFCINSKCKNKDFEKIDSESDSFEIGYFIIDDLDFNKAGNFLSCYILNHIDYFIEKVRDINLGEDVEILGILRINYFDLKTRRETQRFEYYIEVFDIKPKKTKAFNDAIISILEGKLKIDNSYFEKLIDATHSLTYSIDIYLPIKLTKTMSFVTGGSWNKRSHIRDTLNSIVAGPKSTYKSKIAERFEYIIGKRYYRLHEVNKEITLAGLIGTTQRDSNRTTPTVRYGVLPLYSNGTIDFDESQKITMNIVDAFRCLEKGSTGGLQDATIFNAETKESIILTQNCLKNEDGSYNADETIFNNLGWDDKNSESRLERFDLLYIVPSPDVFIKLRTLENEEKDSMGLLFKEIAEDLELEDYNFPKDIQKVERKIEYVLYHYFHKAKEFYRQIQLSEEDKGPLRKIYREALLDKEDHFKTDTDINIRSLNICYKTLKCLSALRLCKQVNNSIFNYFKQRCMKLIIPFRDSDLINTKVIDMNEIIKEIFRKEFTKDEITTKVLYEKVKAYVRRVYYNDTNEDVFEEEIEDYIGMGYTFEENYKFKKLLKNNEKWLNSNNYFIESGRGKGKITSIRKIEGKMKGSFGQNKKNDKQDKGIIARFNQDELDHIFVGKSGSPIIKMETLMKRLREIAEENNWIPLERKSIIQILEIEKNLEKKYIENVLDELVEEGTLIEKENNFIQFKEKKEDDKKT